MKKPAFFLIFILVLTTLACSFNFSTAKISDVKMAKDPDGTQPTTTYAQDEPFYCVGALASAPDDTKVKAIWTAVEVDGVEPNLNLGEKELTTGGADTFNFSYINEEGKIWPTGKYKVDLYLNDKLDRTLEFQVEGSTIAQEPTPTPIPPTPEPEPTATPEPTDAPEPTPVATDEAEPTAEATVEATTEPTAESTQTSTGDRLAIEATEEATVEPTSEATPLPFKDDPYEHPSGAFTFALPESFKGIAGDKTSVSFGDDTSIVGVAFTDIGEEMSKKEMQTFIDLFTPTFMEAFSNDYEILEQKTQPDDSILLALSYTTEDDQRGDVDIFFEQRDTVVFILYFVTTAYDDMLPTWQAIIDSYSVDPKAAVAAAPAAEPTPKPKPKPTQAPAPAGPSAPAGKGLFIFINNTGTDFVIDVIGPTNDSKVVPPKSQQQFVLNPGHYIINGHSPNGDYYINAYEFDIAVGQVFPLNLN